MLVVSFPTFEMKNVFLLNTNVLRLSNLMLVKYFDILGKLQSGAEYQNHLTQDHKKTKSRQPFSISLNL